MLGRVDRRQVRHPEALRKRLAGVRNQPVVTVHKLIPALTRTPLLRERRPRPHHVRVHPLHPPHEALQIARPVGLAHAVHAHPPALLHLQGFSRPASQHIHRHALAHQLLRQLAHMPRQPTLDHGRVLPGEDQHSLCQVTHPIRRPRSGRDRRWRAWPFYFFRRQPIRSGVGWKANFSGPSQSRGSQAGSGDVGFWKGRPAPGKEGMTPAPASQRMTCPWRKSQRRHLVDAVRSTAPKLRSCILLSEDYLSETQRCSLRGDPRAFRATTSVRARSRAELTQEALADAAGMHRTAISLLELSKRDPQLSTIVKLAGALRITPLELLRGMVATPTVPRIPAALSPGSVDPS